MRGWGLLNYQHVLESFGKNIFIRKRVFFSFRNKDVFKEVCFDFLFLITPHNWPNRSAYIFLHSRNPFWERFARFVLQTKNIGRFVVGEGIYNHHSTSMSPTHHKTHVVTCCYMVDSVTPFRNEKLKNNIKPSNWSLRQGEEIKIEPDEIKKPFLVSFLCKYLFLEVKISFPFYFFDYLKVLYWSRSATDPALQICFSSSFFLLLQVLLSLITQSGVISVISLLTTSVDFQTETENRKGSHLDVLPDSQNQLWKECMAINKESWSVH